MKNYRNSDYAANKYSEGIVYRSVDGTTTTVTLADYLRENPERTAEDFRELKKLSDSDYLEQSKSDYRETWKNVPFDELAETELCAVSSPEDIFIDAEDKSERRRTQIEIAKRVLDKLTDVQRQRFLLRCVKGLTTREIADSEGVTHQSVVESLQAVEKKIKKILAES